MVRAILEGRKTQTRRVVRSLSDNEAINHDARYFMRSDGVAVASGAIFEHDYWVGQYVQRRCPYGVPGDRLWVRETWFHDFEYDRLFYRADADADGTVPYLVHGCAGGGVGNAHIDRWRPSIHMPRWASRLTLEIKAVRVERLQEISEEDARAEGVEKAEATDGALSYVLGFSDLWDSINAKRGYGWHTNPWVWVVEFERVD